MDTAYRHAFEKAQRVFGMAMITLTAYLIMSFVVEDRKYLVLRLIVGIVVIAFNFAAHFGFKNVAPINRVSMHTYSLAIPYLTSLFFMGSTYAFVMMFPIAVTVIMSMDVKKAMIGSSVSILPMIGIVIYNFAAGSAPEITKAYSIELLFMISTCSLILIVTKTVVRQTAENMVEIRDSAERAASLANRSINVTESVSVNVASANAKCKDLDENIDKTGGIIQDIASGMSTTVEEIGHQSEMSVVINNSLSTVDSQTEVILASSQEVLTASQAGMETMKALGESSESVHATNRTVMDSFEQLTARIAEVGEIVEAVSNISKQTNLLALNASIEAARAGEAGKSFAVVAEQIGSLAEDVKQATGRIAGIMSDLNDEMTASSEAMQQSNMLLEQQTSDIDSVRGMFEDVLSQTDGLVQAIRDMSGSVKEVVDANSSITESINKISQMSTDIEAAIENSVEISNSNMADVDELRAELQTIEDTCRKEE